MARWNRYRRNRRSVAAPFSAMGPPRPVERKVFPITLADLANPQGRTWGQPIDSYIANGGQQTWAGFSPSENTSEALWARLRGELERGWPEGAALLKGAIERVALALDFKRRTIERGHFQGFDPNIGDLLEGRAAFSQWGKRPKPARVVIASHVGGACLHSAADLMWSGAVAVLLSELFEASGARVEVWGVSACGLRDHSQRLLMPVKVKAFDEAPVPDLIASVLASPRALRLGFFANMERTGLDIGLHGYWPQGNGLNADDLTDLAFDADRVILVPEIRSESAARDFLAGMQTEVA